MASAAMLGKAMMSPLRVSSRRPVFDFKQRASIDYKVNLLPSPLYDQPSLGAGVAYFTGLTKNVEIHFRYTIETNPPVDIECSSSVVGTLRIYDTPSKDAVVLWSRQYDLLPQVKASSMGRKVQLDRPLVIDLKQYSQIVDKIYELTEVKPARADITLEWNVQAKTPEGIPVSEPLMSSLVVPVAAKYFTIGGNPSAEGNGTFTVADEKLNTAALTERKIWGIALGVSLAVLLGTLLVPVGEAQKQAKALRNLLGKFGSRIARSRTAEMYGRDVVDLASAEDLLRVADELGKPVIYVPADFSGRPHVFYVLDGDTRYQYSVHI